ncbi:hypothetical protein LCGC14_0327260 [marine sediment metagenome]|uniref:Uncharacterized protein n=2 Tax=root TaxID=1 RepID=A0A0F9TMX5_9ZZZZ
MTLPYASASSGIKARDEILRILKRFGCESVGFMDEFDTHTLLLAFRWGERNIQLRASAQGWANAYLRENPWTYRKHSTKRDWEQWALDQGMIAVNSILRDWVKGQVTAIETGILTFEHVFLPFMLTKDGRTVAEHATKLLAGPKQKPALVEDEAP